MQSDEAGTLSLREQNLQAAGLCTGKKAGTFSFTLFVSHLASLVLRFSALTLCRLHSLQNNWAWRSSAWKEPVAKASHLVLKRPLPRSMICFTWSSSVLVSWQNKSKQGVSVWAGKCGSGPNMRLEPGNLQFSHISTPAKLAQLLQEVCKVDIPPQLLKVGDLRTSLQRCKALDCGSSSFSACA